MRLSENASNVSSKSEDLMKNHGQSQDANDMLFMEAFRNVAVNTSNQEMLDNFLKLAKAGIAELGNVWCLYYLMGVLNNAVVNCFPEDIKKIISVIDELTEQCDVNLLAEGLSMQESRGEHEHAGKSAWYWLMSAFSGAADKYPLEEVEQLAVVVNKLAEKCDPGLLVAGLSASKKNGKDAGKNGWYFLMLALNSASEKNKLKHIRQIAAVIHQIVEKCDATWLAKGLSARIMVGENAGENGWTYLMAAFATAFQEKSTEHLEIIGRLIIVVMAHSEASQITVDQKRAFLKNKKEFSVFLKKYLAQIFSAEQLEPMCSKQRFLGELIDHQRGFFTSSKTETRLFVDNLIKEKKKLAFEAGCRHVDFFKLPEQKGMTVMPNQEMTSIEESESNPVENNTQGKKPFSSK
jgi:hypothetical protein